MKRFQRILVGLALTPDGSDITPGSRRAALQAEWIAEKTGASLTFVHSTWSDVYEDGGVMVSGPNPDGAQALEELAREYRETGIDVELVYTNERPWIDLIRRVQANEGDLVLVARRNDPKKDFIGSVARKLMRKCPAPVWVVKVDSPLVHATVLAATDLSSVGDRAVEYGAMVARAYGCVLHVLHAWQVPMTAQLASGIAGHEGDLDELQRKAEEAVAKTIARHAQDVEVVTHVGRDAPSRAILAGVERLNTDLLVMGTISREGIAGLLVGNTAEKLLDQATCSLLTIKPDGFESPVKPA